MAQSGIVTLFGRIANNGVVELRGIILKRAYQERLSGERSKSNNHGA